MAKGLLSGLVRKRRWVHHSANDLGTSLQGYKRAKLTSSIRGS